jgi:uracil phosphoribosyltransferase
MTEAATNGDVGANIHISKHPVLFHKISILRSSATSHGKFRSVLREVTYHLGYEATANLKTREVPISVSIGREKVDQHTDCTGHKISERVCLIPILRSGLGMTDSMLELLPNAAVHHIGMYHIAGSAPVQYFNRLPRKCESDVAFVVDPVIASAETILCVVAILKKVRKDDAEHEKTNAECRKCVGRKLFHLIPLFFVCVFSTI